MNIEKQQKKRGRRWLIFEILLLIGLYLLFGYSEAGWGVGGIFSTIFSWVVINIPIGIADPMNDPYDP